MTPVRTWDRVVLAASASTQPFEDLGRGQNRTEDATHWESRVMHALSFFLSIFVTVLAFSTLSCMVLFVFPFA